MYIYILSVLTLLTEFVGFVGGIIFSAGFVGGITYSTGGVFVSSLSAGCSCGWVSVLMANSCGALGNGGKGTSSCHVAPLKDPDRDVTRL